MLGDVMLSLVEDQITGGAGRNNLAMIALGQRQIPARQRIGSKLVDGHVSSRSAAVPIFDLVDLDIESAEDSQQGFLISASGSPQRLLGIVGVSHNPSSLRVAATDCSSVSISPRRWILSLFRGMRPARNSLSPSPLIPNRRQIEVRRNTRTMSQLSVIRPEPRTIWVNCLARTGMANRRG